jgi:putative DNA primase/helicase
MIEMSEGKMSRDEMKSVGATLTASQAIAQIAADISSYLKDGPDREADNLSLAERSGLRVDGIAKRWAEAKALAAKRVAEQKVINFAPLVRKPLPKSLKAKFAPEPEPAAGPPSDQPTLRVDTPYETAGEYIRRQCMVDGKCVLWFWQDQFYRWSGRVYEVVPIVSMESQLYLFLANAVKGTKDGYVKFHPTPKHVSDILHCLRSRVALGNECQPPMWLETREPANDWVVFKNKVVNVCTEAVSDLTPDFWTHSALGFDWAPDAECIRWRQFLTEVFPGDGPNGEDEESVNFIEEWIGYCMTEETRFEKAALFVGPKRSGKGTIAYVMRRLVGDPNYVGLSFSNWNSGGKSTEPLIGKLQIRGQ